MNESALWAFAGRGQVTLLDGTPLGDGRLMVTRPAFEDDSEDYGFAKGWWWGSMELDEPPSPPILERLRSGGAIRVRGWRGFVSLLDLTVVSEANGIHYLVIEAG